MKLSIVIPCYNEKNTIEVLLEKVDKVSIKGIEKEVIVIDDCSTDGTSEILQKCSSKIKLIKSNTNQGKGEAVKKGFLYSTGDLVIVQDADLEYDPQDYQKMIEPMLAEKLMAVYGSRFLENTNRKIAYFSHYLANKFITKIFNIVNGSSLTDVLSCYKAFNGNMIRELAPSLKSPRFGFDVEITAKITSKNSTIKEVPISYIGRTRAEGKKIRYFDGLLIIKEILKHRITSFI